MLVCMSQHRVLCALTSLQALFLTVRILSDLRATKQSSWLLVLLFYPVTELKASFSFPSGNLI